MIKREKVLDGVAKTVDNASDAEIAPTVKKQLAKELEEAREELRTPLETDKWIYRWVVAFLGLAILGCLFFTFFLSMKDTDPNATVEIPEIFLAIGSAAVGALAGLLAPSPGRGGG